MPIQRTYAELTRANGRVNVAVQQHIDNIDSLTEQQIDTLPLQPYLRQGLKDIKRQKVAATDTTAIEARIKIETLSSVEGDIRRWTGDRTFIAIEHGGSVEILPNKLVWFPSTGGFWYETIFAKTIAPQLFNTVFVKKGRKLDYMTMYRNEINGNVDDARNSIIDMTGNQKVGLTNSLAHLPGVRIGR